MRQESHLHAPTTAADDYDDDDEPITNSLASRPPARLIVQVAGAFSDAARACLVYTSDNNEHNSPCTRAHAPSQQLAVARRASTTMTLKIDAAARRRPPPTRRNRRRCRS